MALTVRNVSKTFGTNKAVDNLSFEIAEPGIFGLLGTNGAGKTTTIRMILGIMSKDEGEILWDGKEVSRKTVSYTGIYRKNAAYIPKCGFLSNWCISAACAA